MRTVSSRQDTGSSGYEGSRILQQPLISEISRKRKLRLLLDNLEPSVSILEVGAGSGWFSDQLRNNGHAVTTLDIEAPADIVGDITQWQQLGIAAHTFDAVVALEVIEHIDCLASLQSLCKPGGLIMLSSPHPNWDWVMKILEHIGLNQKRTSAHVNLTDFSTLSMPALVRKRPMLIHQVALFRNSPLQTG